MFLRQITDEALAQYAYLIGCPRSGEAIVIDPERDVDRYLKLAAEHGLRLTAVADTHIHADYLSGARELMEHHGVVGYFSAEGGPDWQFEWAKSHPAARFLRDGDTFKVGNIELKAFHSPGHTPEHLSYLVTDIGGGSSVPMALLSGDFIFVGDVGRPDLLESAAGQVGIMEPSARTLYHSLRRTGVLPDFLQILPAHGAGSACGKALGAVPTSVLGYERLNNQALRGALGGTENDFVADILSGQPEPPPYFARMKRDNKLGPALLPMGKLPAPPRLSADAFAALAKSGEHRMLDLRQDRGAFMARQIATSLFAPIAGGKLPLVAGSYLQQNASILLLVENAAQVDEAVRQLLRIGLDRIAGWIPVEEALAIPSLVRHQTSIAAADLADAIKADPTAQVIDVRSAGEFTDSHVAGAKHLAYTRLATRLAEIRAGRTLFVHCGSGLRAALAAPYLASLGHQVVHVDGDFESIPASLKTSGDPPAAKTP